MQELPGGFEQVFFTNSGSEAVDTALKIALAYQRAIGQGGRTRLIGRERGYHGTNMGGTTVGGRDPARAGGDRLVRLDSITGPARHVITVGRDATMDLATGTGRR